MIKALIFDLDNTLYNYDEAHKAAFDALSEYACRTFGISAERFSDLHREGIRLQKEQLGIQNAAIHNRLIRFQMILEQLGEPVSYAPRMAEVYWSAFLSQMQPEPETEAALSFAKSAGYTVGVGTNMTADYQFAKLERLGLMEYIDFIVTSEEAGVEKPDAGLFALCVKKAGCTAAECVFVGDSLECDVLGAKEAGLHPVWLCPGPRRTEEVPGVDRLPSLKELPALLQA